MAKINLADKACAVIEHIVSDDFCEDLEINTNLHQRVSLSSDDIKLIAKKISQIYIFSHAINGHPCYHVHSDWREELNQLYRKLVRNKQIRGVTVIRKESKNG